MGYYRLDLSNLHGTDTVPFLPRIHSHHCHCSLEFQGSLVFHNLVLSIHCHRSMSVQGCYISLDQCNSNYCFQGNLFLYTQHPTMLCHMNRHHPGSFHGYHIQCHIMVLSNTDHRYKHHHLLHHDGRGTGMLDQNTGPRRYIRAPHYSHHTPHDLNNLLCRDSPGSHTLYQSSHGHIHIQGHWYRSHDLSRVLQHQGSP